MPSRQLLLRIAIVASLLAQLVLGPLAAAPVQAATPPVVDDFETGLPSGLDGTVAIGFNTFQDPNSTVSIATTATPPWSALTTNGDVMKAGPSPPPSSSASRP